MALAACAAGFLFLLPIDARAQAWQVGDVFVGVSDPYTPRFPGQYFVYDRNGVPKATDTTGIPLQDPARDWTTGCFVDPQTGRFWGTNFYSNQIVPFTDTAQGAQVGAPISTAPFVGPNATDPSVVFPSATESVMVAREADGTTVLWAGTVDSSADQVNADPRQHLLKFNTSGQLLGDFLLERDMRGIDWFDIANDGRHVYYTSEGAPAQVLVAELPAASGNAPTVRRIPIRYLGQQIGNTIYALRLLPPHDGSGGMLVATDAGVSRTDADGNIIDGFYSGTDVGYFALSLTPDGRAFWTATYGDAAHAPKVFKFNIAASRMAPDGSKEPLVVIRPGAIYISGVCVKLEPTALAGCPVLDANGNPVLDATGHPQFGPCPPVEMCGNSSYDSNGVLHGDEDGDGVLDAIDPDCALPGATEVCGDRVDNDSDGFIDEDCPRVNQAGDVINHPAPFVISPTVINVPVPPAVTVTGLPAGLQATGDGGVSGTILESALHDNLVVTVVTRGSGPTATSVSASFHWFVNHRPAFGPVPPSPLDQASFVGGPVSVQIAATDPDGDAVSLLADGLPPGLSVSGTTISGTPTTPGTYTVTLTPTDGTLYGVPSTFVWVVSPNSPPDCSNVSPRVSSVWPPNHKLVPVSVLGVTDGQDGANVQVRITGVFQDEPTLTVGDGNTPSDAVISGGARDASVRAERSGAPKVPGNGRVYHIAFTAIDSSGASCTGEVRVSVPHDQNKRAVDDGIKFDSITGARIP